MCESVENIQTIKCMILGDSLTGKTHLFRKFTSQQLPVSYEPTVFDISNLDVESKTGQKLNLNLWDSAGSHTYDSIRPISYAHTDCFIICYSVENNDSLENVTTRWLPEIMKHGDGPTVPLILVSTHWAKNDGFNKEESDKGNETETESHGKNIQEKIKARTFFSCRISASMEENVDYILQTAIDLAFAKKQEDDMPSDPIWKFCFATVAFIGDTGVGKSSLIEACIKNKPLQRERDKTANNQSPEYYHNFIKDGCECFLRFIETSCKSKGLTSIINENKVDVLVLCYAINDPFSFQTAELMLQSLQDQLKIPPIILCGNKIDLKDDALSIIPTIDGNLLKQRMSCVTFIECSAKTSENVAELVGGIQDSIKIN